MKASLYIIAALCAGTIMASCSEEKLTAEPEQPRYNVADDPNDAIQHTKFTMFENYRTYLITNPTTADYKFNFQQKNNLLITAPQQSKDLLAKGIARFEKLFMSVYSEAFKKQYMPFSIILADSILFLEQENGRPSYHAYAANRFLAMAGVRPGMENDTDSLLREIKGDIHARFWVDYMEGINQKFELPQEFFEPSKSYYRKSADEISVLGDVTGKLPDQINFHPAGFIMYNRRTTFFDPDPDWGGWWIEAPDEDTDKRQWIAFVFSTPKAEREAIIAEYPIMKQKYDLLKAAFLKSDNFNIDLLP